MMIKTHPLELLKTLGVCIAWLIWLMTYSRRVWLAALSTTPTAKAKPNPYLTPANPPSQNFINNLI